MPAPVSDPTDRRPELDWLLVVALLLLHVFHTGMLFNTWSWLFKAPEWLPALDPPTAWLNAVGMPLLMFVSGVLTAQALRRRGLGGFVKERVRRLLGPFVFGAFVVVPPQLYVGPVARGTVQESYWDFYASIFQLEPYFLGIFIWHQQWFVACLLLYSLLAVQLFAALGTPRGGALFARVEAWLAHGTRPWLLFLTLPLPYLLPLPYYPETSGMLHDPQTFFVDGLLFLLGYLMGRGTRLTEQVTRWRHRSLALSLGLLALHWFVETRSFMSGTLVREVGAWILSLGSSAFQGLGLSGSVSADTLVLQAHVWSVLLTCLGYARVHIRTRSAWVAHAQPFIYPFYILHQTVIVLVRFALPPPPGGPWAHFAQVLGVSFGLTWALCELIQRVPWLRPCFGMAPRQNPLPGA